MSSTAKPIDAGPITLLGIPYDGSSSYARGAAEAPSKIREALRCPSSNSWTEEGLDISVDGALQDAGDVEFTPGEDVRSRIEAGVSAIYDRGARALSLGGDHSVTYPIVRAVRRFAPRLTIVHFDAHPDLYDEFEGDRWSHACPMARIMEE